MTNGGYKALTIRPINSLIAPWWGVKVPRGQSTSSSKPAGQYRPRAQGKPGPDEPVMCAHTDTHKHMRYTEKWPHCRKSAEIRFHFIYSCSCFIARHFFSISVFTEVSVSVQRLTCRTKTSFSASLTGCPTCLTQLFSCCTSRARWPVRGGSALFTVIALWAQELGGRSLRASFQTVKPSRKVYIDMFPWMFFYRMPCICDKQLAHLKCILENTYIHTDT